MYRVVECKRISSVHKKLNVWYEIEKGYPGILWGITWERMRDDSLRFVRFNTIEEAAKLIPILEEVGHSRFDETSVKVLEPCVND